MSVAGPMVVLSPRAWHGDMKLGVPIGTPVSVSAALPAQGQAKIRHLRRAVPGEHDIARLEVARHDAILMRDVDGIGQRGNECSRLASRLRSRLNFLGQVAALNQLHREVRPASHFANVIDLHDVGVSQAGDRLRFAQKALQLFRPGAWAGQ